MFTHTPHKDARSTSVSNSNPANTVGWPTLACHLEASPWAGLYDDSDEVIHIAVRGDNATRATFAQRRA